MAERQPGGCLCFMRRDQKRVKSKVDGGTPLAVGASQHATARAGQTATVTATEDGPQPGRFDVSISAAAADTDPATTGVGLISPVAPARALPATDAGAPQAAAPLPAPASHASPSASSSATALPTVPAAAAAPLQAADSLREPGPSAPGLNTTRTLPPAAPAAAETAAAAVATTAPTEAAITAADTTAAANSTAVGEAGTAAELGDTATEAGTAGTADVAVVADTADAPIITVGAATTAAEPGGASQLEDARELSTVSITSTAFFSAGGWSQFGDDGEWLGGAPSALHLQSLEDLVDEATTAAATGAELGSRRPQLHMEAPRGQPASWNDQGGSRAHDQEQQQQQEHQQDLREPHHVPAAHDVAALNHAASAGRPGDAAAAIPAREPAAPWPAPPLPSPGNVPPVPQPQPPAGRGASVPLVTAAPERSETETPTALREGGGQEEQQQQQQGDPQDPPREDGDLPAGGIDDAGGGGNGSGSSSTPGGGAGAAGGAPSEAAGREAVLDRVAELYGAQGRPCKACEVLLQFCKADDLAPESLAAELRARNTPDAAALTQVVSCVSACLTDLASDEGWQVVRSDELQLLYRNLPGQRGAAGVHAFRARCVLDYPVEEPLALAREVDLCPTWNKYCTSATILRDTSGTEVAVYISVWVPWPFNNVGFLLEAIGSDLLDEEGCLLVCFSTPVANATGSKAPPALPPGAEKHGKVRLLPPSCMAFRPLPPKSPGGPQRTMCDVQTFVDPGLRHVPPFIISFVLKVLSPFVYWAVKKVLSSAFKSPTNPLPKRIQQRAELYGLVKRRTDAYLRSKGAGEAGVVAAGPPADAAVAAAADMRSGSRRG